MSAPILATKLYTPPPRPDLVPRPRLIERLNEGLPYKLTLISAPVGFGKTSLVSEWLQQLDLPCTWLSLDEGDSELTRFLSYTIAALQKIDADLGQAVLSLLQLIEPPSVKTIMTLLINDIVALKHRFILIFDDYHLIQNLDVHQALAFLLDQLPSQLHLVVISREDPPFPLARLRVRRQISEIRSHDLQFSLEEAAQFLNQTMRLNLQPEAIATLEQRTEGWVAGLQMAAIALQAHLSRQAQANPTDFVEAFAGDDRYVVDYLIAEALELQPPHILDFLQQTSILKRFTATLCEAVTAQENAPEILTHLEEANLFLVALDNRREWYRYHHLFGDLLYHRLKQTAPAQIPRLHHRASRWHQAQGFIEEAIHHALEGEDYAYAADLIEQMGLKMVGQGRLNRLQQWIVSLPESLIVERPYLAVLLAWISVLHRQPDQAERHLAMAEPAIQNLAENSILKPEIVCQMALLQGYISRLRYDLLTSIDHIQQAIKLLPVDHAFLQCTTYLNLGGNYWGLGNFAEVEAPLRRAATFLDVDDTIYPALAAAGYLANAYLQRGQLGEAANVCRHVEQVLAPHRRPPPALSYVAIEQGMLFYERNDLEAATACLSRAIKLGENLDRIVNIGRALLMLAWIQQATGHPDEAAALLERAGTRLPPTIAEFDHYRVRLWLALGDLEAAGQWAKAYEPQRGSNRPWHVLNELTFAHILLAEKAFERVQEVVVHCEASAQASGNTGWLIRSLALKALASQAMGNIDQALDSLDQALVLAKPAGYYRTFLDHGPPMQQLLQQAAVQGIAPTYVSQLLAAFSAEGQGRGSVEEKISPLLPRSSAPLPNTLLPLVEPLNDRELSILRLMAAGLSNREIADELYLSTNTVKWYGSQIYGKLGVKKRAEAVDRAHELGIL